MTTATESLLLDHYHCTFFLPLIGVADKDFQPRDQFAWVYPANATLTEAEAAQSNPESEMTRASEVEAQAYRYFSPAIRNILFDFGSNSPAAKENESTPLQAVKEWRIPPEMLASWELHLGNKNGEDNTSNPLKYQIAKVTSVILYRYFNGIYLLAFRVIPKALHLLQQVQREMEENKIAELTKEYRENNSDNEPGRAMLESIKQAASDWLVRENNGLPLFWNTPPGSLFEIAKADPSRVALYEQLQLESWLNFTRLARLIYPSFPQQNNEKKIAPIRLFIDGKAKAVATAFEKKQKVSILKKPGEDISPVIRYLLKEFARQPETVDDFFDHHKNVYDDRMFVSVAYGLAGKQLPQELLEKLFHRVLYVDRHEEAWDCMDGYAYTPEVIKKLTQPHRFDLWNGLGSYFGYTGFSNVYLSRGFDFRCFIAPEHIPQIYDRMLIQALFYQASLRYYDDNICRETQGLLIKNDLKAIREQRKAFIRFTNQYWFHNLTEQMQGKAIFNLQQETLDLKKYYDIIKDELERTDEYLHTEHEIRISEVSSLLTHWGVVIALIALYYAVLPMTLDYIKEAQGISLWKLMESYMPPLLGGGLILLGIPLIIALTVRGIHKIWRGNK